MTWRRLGVLVRQLPFEAAIHRSIHGAAAEWGAQEHLLASIVDVLQAANWQRGGDKHAQRPKPIYRPGQVQDDYKPKARPLGEVRRVLEDWNAGRLQGHKPTGAREVT